MNAIIRHCVVVAAILAPILRVLGADDRQPGSPVLDVYMIRNQELRYKWCDTTNTKRCCNQGTTNPEEGCIMFGLDLGKSPRTLLDESIRLVYNELSAGSRLYSPVGFRLVAGAAIHSVSRDKTQEQTPRTITLCDSAGRFRTFRFKDGASTALIETGSAEYAAESVTMLDANGWATTVSPSVYEYSDPKGRLFRFGADPSDPETYLQLVSVRYPGGRTETGDDIGFEILRDAEGTPRQIVGPAKIAVLPDAPTGEVGYDIVLYPNDASTTSWQRDAAGFYILDPEAEPLVTWRVRNPDPETEAQVDISKVVGDATPVTWRFIYDPELEDFSLVYPDAVMKAFSGLYFSEDGNSVVREKYKTADGEKFSHETTEFRKFGNVFRRISTTRDPDGLALRSEYAYYDDATRNGLEKSVVYEDGSWERFDYDASRRLSKKVSPWLDSDLDDPDEESVCTTYDYAPFLASDVVRWNDTRPRVETTRTTGIETSRFYYAYPTNGAGRSLSIKEQAGAQGAPFGDPRNRRWTTEFYGPADGAFLHGRVAVETDFTGWTATHSYERGFVNLATYAFAPDLAGDAWRETILRTKPGAMTRRFRSVRTAQGNEVLSTEEGLHESGEWIPLATVKMAYDRNGNLVRRETQDGRVEEWSYGLNCCGMESHMTWDGQRHVYTYDKLGNMLSDTLCDENDLVENGVCRLFRRRPDGLLLSEQITNFVAGLGSRVVENNYDGIGRIISSVDTLGRENRWLYRPASVVKVTPFGIYQMDSFRNDYIKMIVSERGVTNRLNYGVSSDGTRWNSSEKQVSQNNSILETVLSDYFGRETTREKSGFGHSTDLTFVQYDVTDHPVRVSRLNRSALGVEKPVESKLSVYDADGRLIVDCFDVNGNGIIDYSGPDRVTEYRFSWTNNVDGWYSKTETCAYPFLDSSESVVRHVRSKKVSGFCTSVDEVVDTDAIGAQTRTIQSASGKLFQMTIWKETSLLPLIFEVENGLLVRFVSETGSTNRYCYDGLRRRIGMTDGNGRTSEFRYDDHDLVTWETDETGKETFYVRDGNGNVIKEAFLDGAEKTFGFDAFGNCIFRDGAQIPVVFRYDNQNRMTGMFTNRKGLSVPDIPDDVFDSEDWAETEWEWDFAANLLTKKTYADGTSIQFEYGPNGKLSRRIDERGIQTDYQYDNANEIAKIAYSDGTPGWSFVHDREGQLISAISDSGLTNLFYYAANGTLTNEIQYGIAISRLFDVLGRQTVLETSTGYRSETHFDSFGRLSSHGPTNGLIHYVYESDSDLPDSFFSSTFEGRYARDSRTGNVSSLLFSDLSGNVLVETGYQYDARNRVNLKETRINGVPQETVLLRYDKRDNVTEETRMGDTTNSIFRTFDSMNNLVMVRAENDIRDYNYNDLNQLIGSTNGLGSVCQFDASGNQVIVETQTGIWYIDYDAENRPVLWTNAEMVVAMNYDYNGRRIHKTVSSPSGQMVDNHYLYEGYHQIQSFTNGMSELITYWNKGIESGNVPACIQTGEGLFHCFFDLKHNIFATIDANGKLQPVFHYSLFCLDVPPSPFEQIKFAWSSEPLDSETMCSYYGLRFFNHNEPFRWTTRDPVWERGGLSLYTGLSGKETFDYLGLSDGGEDESLPKKPNYDTEPQLIGMPNPDNYPCTGNREFQMYYPCPFRCEPQTRTISYVNGKRWIDPNTRIEYFVGHACVNVEEIVCESDRKGKKTNKLVSDYLIRSKVKDLPKVILDKIRGR